MSITMAVFLDGERMPTPADWARSIRAHGFALDMDPDFDPATFTGFLPCSHSGQHCGFEFFREPADHAQLDADVAARLEGRDTIVSLITHSNLRELLASDIAAGVLAALADGVLWDTEGGEFIAAVDAIQWAKRAEDGIKGEL